MHRTTKAVNYRLRGDSVKVDFHDMMQNASGEAKVTGKKSSVEIDAKFDSLDDPTNSGWNIFHWCWGHLAGRSGGEPRRTGDRPQRQPREGHHGHADIWHDRDRRPYFAVNQPGNMVVMENIISATTVGRQENIDAKYELLGRGTYSATNTKISDAIFGIDRKTPRVLFEARNAVRIANLDGCR